MVISKCVAQGFLPCAFFFCGRSGKEKAEGLETLGYDLVGLRAGPRRAEGMENFGCGRLDLCAAGCTGG
jgi:hypothetical protein